MVSWLSSACPRQNRRLVTSSLATLYGARTAEKSAHEANRDCTASNPVDASLQSRHPQSRPSPPCLRLPLTQGSSQRHCSYGDKTPPRTRLAAPRRAPPRQMAPCSTFTPDTPPTASGASRSPFKRSPHHDLLPNPLRGQKSQPKRHYSQGAQSSCKRPSRKLHSVLRLEHIRNLEAMRTRPLKESP